MKQKIRLTEGDLHRIIKNSVNEVVKKDPMKQWFKDFDDISKFRETMDYITKGGKEPNSHRRNVAKALGRNVSESLNEISWRKVADAYGAAKDRESHFPSQYTDAQLTRRHRNDDGEFDREYDDELHHTHNSRQYPQKFYKEAVRRLSQEIFGEDSVEDAISNAIGTERFQDVLSKVNEYQKNLEYINNNPTKFNWR